MADALVLLADRAAAAARDAGAALRQERARWARVEAVEGREVKITADREAEAIILDHLKAWSSDPILSEETGWSSQAASGGRFWAVDPLDGSVNYLLGYPHCGVSIALVENQRPILGVFYNFVLEELFVGVVGSGATLNGAPIAVSTVSAPEQGVLSTGIPAAARTDDPAMAALVARMRRFRKVRMIGSAAAALANVAAGRADAYHEAGTRLWDVAAGCALVEAAGGRVRIDGAALDGPLEVLADNGRLPELAA